ncbi:Predicted flavoprotein CzcO associated with the cation diffusion facilitator CzcD [Actinokineospora alba]|uniref:Predicted flavoprotein CzcO associated with the cation diffusion facilitator CzcD n=1 Tax=Actinokineospora alba TaxID=504798 RepID=A0A1H0JZD3_9PSEU|nr:FAD-dependent oxidoreductase [Actinokineospora alba]TDP68105.1 cation diffusion facilitator CzcD-associated flavoprotein CzcO [Actinokineospora alba]SDH92373.1 Predicted flavoprotein CzcO associated with the cation diffusion facilitator CzcD [Actinokineospora alba]SDO49014.1 Predicted flavoprotein CzcO associated with the cation diffusion facilitator CzcD [Actinokineospora alba]
MTTEVDVAVIGAGQAGLSSAYFLRRAELDFVVLDANPGPGGAWQHRWPTLRLGGVHGIHELPYFPFESDDLDRPAAEVVAEYFGAYERKFALPIRRPVKVHSVTDGPRLRVETDHGDWSARALINATGTWDRPFWPHYPGQADFLGTQLHTADYPGPAAFTGKRVVVVGGGASAVQALMEIATVAATTTWVTRRPPVFRTEPFTQEVGRAAVARVDEAVRAGRSPASVVSVTGLSLTPEVIAARESGVLDRQPMFSRVLPTGVSWADGRIVEADVILWATGFRAALDHLAPLGLRGPGGGIVMDGTRVAADPRLHLVGYGPSASTIGANRAGRAAVREIRALLGQRTTSAA